MQKDNRLAWGISLLVFGILFLIRQLHIFPNNIADIIFNLKNYPLILGVIFLVTHRNKNIGLVLLVVGVLFRLSEIRRLTQHISDYVWPLLLILAGGVLVFGALKAKK
ncbi:MAG: hypothetical protein AUK44_01940 [Porphyromonadaceae bacterium CG2_30_38_12]|nr:MAG: hypothetical protein AUK44_01940 [Porphyromonadaceae bacterium CG2_30_38_12]